MAQIRVKESPWYCGYQALIMSVDPITHEVWAPTEIKMGKVETGCVEISNHCPIALEREQAQILMDDLWNCGLRPREGMGSPGAFTAQGRHLEDMCSLVFEMLTGRQIPTEKKER